MHAFFIREDEEEGPRKYKINLIKVVAPHLKIL